VGGPGGTTGTSPAPVCQASYIVQEYRVASVSEAAGYSTRVQTDRDLP